MLETGDSIDRYRIVELIGKGGMGEVYLADDTELQRRVAIKIFTRDMPEGDARDHLLHEARSASSLSHPNVCTVFEVGEDSGRPFIVMEYVEGRTLDSLIAGRDLPTERVVRYGAQIADAVAHAHERGVVHRDLKSANVVITNDGRAKVLDFGLASTVASDEDSGTRDVTSADVGKVSGTLSYMAPEVLRGQKADVRSDIWALGVILFEASAGRLPFTGDTAFEASTAIMKDSAEIPADTAPGLRALIQRCLEKSPGERYQSAAEVRAALETLQLGSSTSSDSVSPEVAAAARAASGSRWVPAAAAFSVIAVVALGAWVVLGQGGGDGEADTATVAGVGIGASGRPTIAVLPFRDRTGSEDMAWLAEGVPSMLLTSLAQTEGLDVVSNSRSQQIVEQLGRESLQDLDAEAVAEFSRRSGAGAIVVGDIYYTGEEHRIDVRVEDVNQGTVLDAYSVSGPFVFELADDLAAQIRAGLALDGGGPAESLTTVATDSEEAFRLYDEGVIAMTNVRYPDAIAAFEGAIAADPTFVMAHHQLSTMARFMPDPSAGAEFAEYAMANRDRVTERDRLKIEGTYALLTEEDYDKADRLLEELVATYPDDEEAWFRLSAAKLRGELGYSQLIEVYERAIAAIPTSGMLRNQFGYALADSGNYVRAIREIERYRDLNPEEINPRDSLAEMYVVSGQPREAAEIYDELLLEDPGWLSAHFGRAMTAGMLGDFPTAFEFVSSAEEVWFGQFSNTPSVMPMARAMILAKLGRYDEAISTIDDHRQRMVNDGTALVQKTDEIAGGFIALEAGDYDQARRYSGQALENIDAVDLGTARESMRLNAIAIGGVANARSGNLEDARTALATLRNHPRAEIDPLPVHRLAGELALVEGDLDTAELEFGYAEPELKATYSASQAGPTILYNNHPHRDGIARVNAARGDLDEAVRLYVDLIDVNTASKYHSFVDPRYVLRLAEALDENGEDERARAAYLRFADLWQDADEQFQPEVERARARAAELGR